MFAFYAPLRNFVARRNFTPEDFHRRWIGPVTRCGWKQRTTYVTSASYRCKGSARDFCQPPERARDAVRCCFGSCYGLHAPYRPPPLDVPDLLRTPRWRRTRVGHAACAFCLPRTDQRPRCGANVEPACAACTAVAVAAAVGHHGHPPASPQRSYSHCNTHRHNAVQRATASPTPHAASPYKPSGTCSWTSRASVARCRTRRPLARHVQQPSVSLARLPPASGLDPRRGPRGPGSVMGWPCACHRALLELSEPVHPPSHAPRVARAQDCASI